MFVTGGGKKKKTDRSRANDKRKKKEKTLSKIRPLLFPISEAKRREGKREKKRRKRGGRGGDPPVSKRPRKKNRNEPLPISALLDWLSKEREEGGGQRPSVLKKPCPALSPKLSSPTKKKGRAKASDPLQGKEKKEERGNKGHERVPKGCLSLSGGPRPKGHRRPWKIFFIDTRGETKRTDGEFVRRGHFGGKREKKKRFSLPPLSSSLFPLMK